MLLAEGYGAVLRWHEIKPGKVLNEFPLAICPIHAECYIHSCHSCKRWVHSRTHYGRQIKQRNIICASQHPGSSTLARRCQCRRWGPRRAKLPAGKTLGSPGMEILI